jgi:8-oxo-dGTP pyrophosphatase MutT (NUDIX family)
MIKDNNPGCYDLSTGGVFGPDEPPMLNAERELKEELNLDIRHPKALFRFLGYKLYLDQAQNNFCALFMMRAWDDSVFDNLKLQETEVESVEWWSIPKVLGEIKQ